MICLRCNNKEFSVVEATVEQEFHGETITVQIEVTACKHCGWQTLTDGQPNALIEAIKNAYHTEHVNIEA